MARSGKKVMQFLSEGRYVANVVDGEGESLRQANKVLKKRTSTWLVVVSQNDNSFPGVAPEFEGIKTPMPIPDQLGIQPSNPKN